jgi:hypothetical protein
MGFCCVQQFKYVSCYKNALFLVILRFVYWRILFEMKKGLDESKSELQFCYVIVSAVATLNGHPFCISQLHILFRLKLLILREHTATLDTR